MTILLFCLFLISIPVLWILFDRDLMAPAFIFCVMYTFSIGSALINRKRWGLEISVKTFTIYTVGLLIFILVNLTCKYIFSKDRQVFLKSESIQRININYTFTLVLVVISIITIYMWIKNVKIIAGVSVSLGQIMEAYRLKTSYSVNADVSMPGYITQLAKIVIASGYVYGFIFINNVLSKDFKRRDILLLIPVLLYVIMSIYDSNRLNFLQIAATFVVYYYLLASTDSNFNKKAGKFLCKLLILFSLLLLVFYSVRLLVGREGSKDTGLIEYITMYSGGPLKLFDMFIRDPIHSTDVWGKETFISLNGNLNDLGIINIPKYLGHKEFRSYNGIGLGNVYSAYREWYADFGMTGVVVLQSIFATFFSIFYYTLKSVGYTKHRFALIMYGYMAATIFLHPIDDQFFRMFVSIGFLIYVVIFYAIYMMSSKKIKIVVD